MIDDREFDDDGALLFDVLPSQNEMVAYDKKWGGARGGPGAGKSVGWALWLYGRADDYPIANAYVIGADYSQLRDGFFGSTLVPMLNRFGFEEGSDYIYRENPRPRVTLLGGGGVIQGLSAKLVERLASLEMQTVLIEEPQSWYNGERVMKRIIDRFRFNAAATAAYRYARDRGDGTVIPAMQLQARLSFNPHAVPPTHWLRTMIEGPWVEAGYKCFRLSSRDNYMLHDVDAYVQGLKLMNPPAMWDSVIDGEWAEAGAGAIREFRVGIHCDPPPGIPRGIDPNVPLTWSLDFNVGHMRSGVAQPHVQRRYETHVEIAPGRSPVPRYAMPVPGWQRVVIRFVDEIALDDVGSRAVALEFIRRHGDHARRTGGVFLCGDSTGGSRSGTVDVSSHWQTIKDELTRASVPYHDIIATNPRVVDSVTDLDAQFCNGDGYGITIDKALCRELVADLETVPWTPDGTNIDKRGDQRRSHALDYARYLNAAIRRQIAGYEAEPARRRAIPFLAR